MKKTFSLFLALLFMLCLACPAYAAGELKTGTYDLTSYETGGATMDAQYMPDTYFTVKGDGKGVLSIQGIVTDVTYDGNTIYVANSPAYTYEVTGSNTVRINMYDILYLDMKYTEPASSKKTSSSSPSSSSVKISFGTYSTATAITVYRSDSSSRDDNWTKYKSIDAHANAFTDDAPSSSAKFYKIQIRLSDGTTHELIYQGSDILFKWVYNSSGKITSGKDYKEEITYEYVYEKNTFRYRKKTYENLEAGVDYTYDTEVSKISSSRSTATTYAITLNRAYEDCIGMTFEFQISQVTKGSPYGTWRLYVRLSTNKKWKEASTYTVKDGSYLTVTKTFKNPFSINKVAFLGPHASYSCKTSKVIKSITVKDYSY